MSTYQPSFKEITQIQKADNPEQVLFGIKKRKTLKELRNWFREQKWTRNDLVSYENSLRGRKSDEASVLIHGTDLKIEDIVKAIESTDFISLGLNVKFKSFEQASWNKWTYFLDFTFLG